MGSLDCHGSERIRYKDNVRFQQQEQLTKRSYRYLGVVVFAMLALIVVIVSFHESSKNTNQRILSQQSQSVIAFLSYLLDLVSSMANTLKIIFQLTALLFIITDLVNFWNLASIYIFLPIEIPPFAKEILQNVWTQFNLPILSFFNVSFDTITFKQKSGNYSPEEEYLGGLELDVSEIVFEPMFVLAITGIELIFLTIVLRLIKRSFRKLRDHVSKGIKLEDVYMKALPLQSKGPQGQRALGFFENLLKNKKITPLSDQKHSKDMTQSNQVDQNANQSLQESMKKIIDNEISSIITQHIQIEPKQPQHIPPSTNKSQPPQYQVQPQLKVMFMIHKIAQNKIKSSQGKIKSQKHWSQTISIDQFQILSALVMSFMPVVLLPLYGIMKNMQYRSLMEKANDLIYLVIVSVIFIYPFVYLMAKLNSTRKRKMMRKRKNKARKQGQIKNQVKSKPKSKRTLTEIKLKEEVFETFYMFFMNMSIPITVAIRSNPVIFLSMNLMAHVLLVASSIIFYSKRSCQGKFQKYNKTIQLFTFLLYHLCFCFVHIFNQAKDTLLENKYLDSYTVNSIDQVMGVMIIAIFTIGGLHQMLEFLIKIIYTVFKIIYMLLHVFCGGYDIKELEEDMKKYSKARPLIKIQSKVPQVKESKKATVMVREQNEAAPKNTDRSLSELGIDFQIQIVKNQIIVNKMKLQLIKEQEKIFGSDQLHLKDIEEINLQSLEIHRTNSVSSRSNQDQSECENIFVSKMASTVIHNNNLSQNKQNAMAQTFPLKKTQLSQKRIKRSHSRQNNELQVKNTQQ